MNAEVHSGGAWTPGLGSGGNIGTSYCGPAVPNSSGMPALITAAGSVVAACPTIMEPLLDEVKWRFDAS